MARKFPTKDGLNYADPDQITPAEIEAFRDFYRRTKGYSIPGLEFWIEFRPDVLKRYRYWVHQLVGEEEAARPLPRMLSLVHYYAIVGFGQGVKYEMRLAQGAGATKEDIIDTLAVAFIHGGPMGSDAVATHAAEPLRGYACNDQPSRWPPGWSFDAKAFDSGVDFTSPQVGRDEIDRIQDWYATTLGEVPRHVRLLAKYRPAFLKAYRSRFETAIRLALPKQMMPYLLLTFAVTRCSRDGIRESVLMARAFGMTRAQVLDAICGALYGGMDAIGLADEAAGDLIATMD